MKILAIRIKNLASLEGNTEIDFTAEPLSSAGIFAITGSTGAGKSTILDALCLALYGKTPRYLQAKEAGIEIQDVLGSTLSQGDVRSILRDGTADGFAQVDFRGIDDQHYRATWSVRRARNKAEGSMQSDAVTLRNITSNIDFPGKKQETLIEITRLVGLNFDQFTRSVLLAQGDFTAFMKATKDEKSSLLEKLTGTHIYSEISKKIYEKYKNEDQQLRDLNLKKEGIAVLNEEELKKLLEEQSLLESQLKVLDKEIASLQSEIDWYVQLEKLQTGHLEAKKALQQSIDNKSIAIPRRQKLMVTEHAQQTRSWADALKNSQRLKAEKTTTLLALKGTITSLHEKKKELEIQFLASGNDLEAKTNSLNSASPLLVQARKLDILLSEKKEQLDIVKMESESAADTSNNHKKLLDDKQFEFRNLSEQISNITDWKSKNNDRSPIATNKDIILSKLQDAQKLLSTLQSSTNELEELRNKTYKDETAKEALEGNLVKQTQEWESLKKSYDVSFKELQLTPYSTLSLNKEEVDLSVENIIKAQSSWQRFYDEYLESESLQEKQQLDRSDYDKKQHRLEELSLQLITDSAQKETASELLKQARLAASENVESLRESLVADSPCPVCGSISHPYAGHNPQLENVLKKLEEAFAEKERLYLANYREHNALEQECSTLQQTIEKQEKDIELKKASVQTKKQVWEQFAIAKESQAVANNEKASWIDEKSQTLKTEQANLGAKIQVYVNQKQRLELDKTNIDILKEAIDSLTNQVKDIKSIIALNKEQQNGKIKEQNQASLDLIEVENILTPYFTNTEWMENWKSSPLAFVEQIDSFAKLWKENEEKLAQSIIQKGALEATLSELEIQARTYLTELTKKTDAYAIQNQYYLNLNEERNSIFEGKSTEQVEIQLKEEVTAAQNKLDELKEKQQALGLDIAKSDTQQTELLQTLNILEEDIKKTKLKIEVWISEFNTKNNQSITNIELQDLLLLNSDWIENERLALQIIDDEVTKTTSILSERNNLLEVHQEKSLSERPLDDLNILITTVKSELELQKHRKGEIGFELQQDIANKNKIGALLKSIETQSDIAENWSKLNEIIGSADGKKFRQIAQEYTLDVLLGYANVHLQVLTNRYRIERIPTSLGLQVVDQDMGDEVRTVYSLSGGESFLVSLALALGLASLSSSRMKVESLFIDEGFGSLDPTTLNIAMDALERLHNQGRKVGVISHVHEMTERIPVQIQVSKQQSGKSMVEVIGY